MSRLINSKGPWTGVKMAAARGEHLQTAVLEEGKIVEVTEAIKISLDV